MRGRLADVGNYGDAVHGFFVVTDLQHLQVDLHVGVGHAAREADADSPASPAAAGAV